MALCGCKESRKKVFALINKEIIDSKDELNEKVENDDKEINKDVVMKQEIDEEADLWGYTYWYKDCIKIKETSRRELKWQLSEMEWSCKGTGNETLIMY